MLYGNRLSWNQDVRVGVRRFRRSIRTDGLRTCLEEVRLLCVETYVSLCMHIYIIYTYTASD